MDTTTLSRDLANTMAVTAARQSQRCPTCGVGVGRACIGTRLAHGSRGLASMASGTFDRVYRETMTNLGHPVA